MPKQNVPLLTYNRGIISDAALSRIDVERVRLSASRMVNWMPKPLGPMTIRPGTEYIGNTYSDDPAEFIEFIAAADDTALIELTSGRMRVWVDDELITRPSVSTNVLEPTFADTGGGDLDTGDRWRNVSLYGGRARAGTQLLLIPEPLGSIARVRQEVAVDTGDRNDEHALEVQIGFGPVTLRVGSDSGGDQYIAETNLETGWHSLSFTPTNAFHIQFSKEAVGGRSGVIGIVEFCQIADTGPMIVPTPWTDTGDTDDLDNIRYDQSADVVFVACQGHRQRRIERRGDGRSWSVVEFSPDNGPFIPGRTANVRMRFEADDDYSGGDANIALGVLHTDGPFFTADNVGSLFRISYSGQHRTYMLGRSDVASEAWEVVGVDTGGGGERSTRLKVFGPFSGEIAVQRSFDGPDAGFKTVQTFTDTGEITIDDSDHNITVWYRLATQDTGFINSGVARVEVDYPGGETTGIAQVIAYDTNDTVDAAVLSPFAVARPSEKDNGPYTAQWNEGRWSDRRGYPTAVQIHEGRLWNAGGAQVWGSVSDEYANFDDTTEGDAAPIDRTLGKGPVDRVTFMQSALRLMLGTSGSVMSVRSNGFDEPITRTNANTKANTTTGAANLRAVVVDTRVMFVHRSLQRLYALFYDINAGDYVPSDLTKLAPDILGDGVVAIAVQRFPDTRIHCVLDDGTVAILTYDAEEDVIAWWKWQPAGWEADNNGSVVEKAMVLPGTGEEDFVYYLVRREINNQTVRFLELWATEAQTSGLDDVWLSDASKLIVGPTTSVTAAHLKGENVVVWADGKSRSPIDRKTRVQTTFLVDTGGNFSDTGNGPIQFGVVGLPYQAEHCTTKLAYGAALGTALTQNKRVDHIGFILRNTHNNGLFFGSDTGNLDPLPGTVDGAAVLDSGIYEARELEGIPFPGDFDTDSRIWLKAYSPHPVTVMASVPSIKTNEKM